MTVASQIRQMYRNGRTQKEIRDAMNVPYGQIYCALKPIRDGRGLDRIEGLERVDAEYLVGCPTISDDAARQLMSRSYPDDEQRTTDEIYAAAEAIRQRRPRDPVGCSPVLR